MPVVCGLGLGVLLLDNGLSVVLDGNRGRLVAQPTVQQEKQYYEAFDLLEAQRQLALQHVHEQAVTLDGLRVPVHVNANQPEEKSGASGRR